MQIYCEMITIRLVSTLITTQFRGVCACACVCGGNCVCKYQVYNTVFLTVQCLALCVFLSYVVASYLREEFLFFIHSYISRAYPRRLLEEAVLNVLVHNDLSFGASLVTGKD